MDSEMIYAMIGILGILAIAYKTLRSSDTKSKSRTKAEVREEILIEYKKKLLKSLKNYEKEDIERKNKKIMILREFNESLAMNIYFDKEDIREIMMKLSAE